MDFATAQIETAYGRFLAGVQRPDPALFAALDTLPAPIYVTDAHGLVIHFNPACIDFAGRMPVVGQDRWCVTWKLYTVTGDELPHERCPMALAIEQKRPITGAIAIAERPDGTRVRFTPYPVPLVGSDGALNGAVNMLLDISDGRQADALRQQADRCRRLSRDIPDALTARRMLDLADEYEAKADMLEQPLRSSTA